MKRVLILGSAPDAIEARQFNLSGFSAIVVMNNAWQILEDWTHLLHPEDFPVEKRPPPSSNQSVITHVEYVPANNSFGGIIYAGGTMAFTTAYWALETLKPDMMLFLGCDMIYDENAPTHFYGTGDADPLRDDPTLQSLEAKANRLMLLSANWGCLCANLSKKPKSRLTFPRINTALFGNDGLDFLRDARSKAMHDLQMRTDKSKMEEALIAEKKANCFVDTGDYWKFPDKRDAQSLAKIDALWLEAIS